MLISRQMAGPLQAMRSKFPILLVTGPRQAGKTTLLRALFPDVAYINLELGSNRDFAREDPLGFLRQYAPPLIIDEAQRVPELFSYLQVQVDETRQMGQYILSGSQNFLLMDQTAQSLAGRVGIFTLLPLSLAELDGHSPSLMPEQVEAAIFQGGYPALYERDRGPELDFPAYVETYLERDVRQVTQVQNLASFRTFLRLCAGRVGQPLNYQSLATDAGVSTPTVKNWLSVLEASYIAFRLPPYFENISKRVVKSPKLYFYDTGLLCHLLDLNDPRQIGQYYNKGSLLENLAVVELLRNRYHHFRPVSLYFWRDSNGTEVDVVLREGGEPHLFEIKYSFTPKASFFKGMQAFRHAAPQLQGRDVVVYAGDQVQARTQGEILPWQALRGL